MYVYLSHTHARTTHVYMHARTRTGTHRTHNVDLMVGLSHIAHNTARLEYLHLFGRHHILCACQFREGGEG